MILKSKNKHKQGETIVFRRQTYYQGQSHKKGEVVPNQDKLDRRTIDKYFRNGIMVDAKKDEVKISSKVVEEEPVKETTDTSSEIATVVVDDGDDFQVEYKGKTFPISRNQLREDGTLTKGGMKAYEQAE